MSVFPFRETREPDGETLGLPVSSEHDHEKLIATTAAGRYHYQVGIAICFAEKYADTIKECPMEHPENRLR